MVRLYMDENVHGAVTAGLQERGVDVLSVPGEGREGAPDPAVLDPATELGRVLFSHDRDLLAEATRRQRAGEQFGGLISAHHQRVTVRACIDDLELIATLGEPEEFRDRAQYLPL